MVAAVSDCDRLAPALGCDVMAMVTMTAAHPDSHPQRLIRQSCFVRARQPTAVPLYKNGLRVTCDLQLAHCSSSTRCLVPSVSPWLSSRVGDLHTDLSFYADYLLITRVAEQTVGILKVPGDGYPQYPTGMTTLVYPHAN